MKLSPHSPVPTSNQDIIATLTSTLGAGVTVDRVYVGAGGAVYADVSKTGMECVDILFYLCTV